jgi:hypothetical protein
VGPDDFSPSKRIFHSWAGKRWTRPLDVMF